MTQVILDYLPGYMFDGARVVSTGSALPPTQHINRRNGEIMYYVRPLFDGQTNVGMFIRHKGVVDSIKNRLFST